jgi:RHS repeat-associated protein
MNGVATSFLWDRESGLPLLIDDGTNGYVHGAGVLGDVGSSSPIDYLNDGLGSVRGTADQAGVLVAQENFNAFGETVAGGTGTAFGFTGEWRDAELGSYHLRARYLDPAIGRFLSADTVQPNAPGTQGHNLYTYVANNPTTWVDPSGYAAPLAGILSSPVAAACWNTGWCAEQLAFGLTRVSVGGLTAVGGFAVVAFIAVACALDIHYDLEATSWTGCGALLLKFQKLIDAHAPDTDARPDTEPGPGPGRCPNGQPYPCPMPPVCPGGIGVPGCPDSDDDRCRGLRGGANLPALTDERREHIARRHTIGGPESDGNNFPVYYEDADYEDPHGDWASYLGRIRHVANRPSTRWLWDELRGLCVAKVKNPNAGGGTVTLWVNPGPPPRIETLFPS